MSRCKEKGSNILKLNKFAPQTIVHFHAWRYTKRSACYSNSVRPSVRHSRTLFNQSTFSQ